MLAEILVLASAFQVGPFYEQRDAKGTRHSLFREIIRWRTSGD